MGSMKRQRDRLNQRNTFWIMAAALAIAAAVVSILATIYTRPGALRFDEKYYFTLARSIAGGLYNDGYIVRPPLYPLFLGAMLKALGVALAPALMVQGLIRGVLVIEIAYMGRKFASRSVGLLAGLLLTIYPLLIWIHTRFLNEAVYVPLFLLSFIAVEKAAASERTSDVFWAGFWSGIASLARATSLFMTFLVAIWLVIRRSRSGRFSKRNLAHAAVLIAALFIAVSPWAIRNGIVHDGFMPLGNEASYNLWFIVSGGTLTEATDQWLSWGNQVDRQREGLRRWRDYISQHPDFHIRRLIKHLPRVFSPVEQRPARGLAFRVDGVHQRRNDTMDHVLKIFTPTVFLILMIGGLAGAILMKDLPHRKQLMLMTVFYFIIVHTATVMKARYFLPITCLLAIPAARFLLWPLTSRAGRADGTADPQASVPR